VSKNLFDSLILPIIFIFASAITSAQLNAIMPGNKHPEYLKHINDAMNEGGINTPARQAAFLAQVAHESGQLVHMKEIASGKAYENRRDLGNIYPGDGKRFKGRGPIQLTGRTNYEAAGKALGEDFVNHPELMEKPENAFRTSVWFWNNRNLNDLADQNTEEAFKKITRKINGGYNGLEDRNNYWNKAKNAL
jgi:predicted chitinase